MQIVDDIWMVDDVEEREFWSLLKLVLIIPWLSKPSKPSKGHKRSLCPNPPREIYP